MFISFRLSFPQHIMSPLSDAHSFSEGHLVDMVGGCEGVGVLHDPYGGMPFHARHLHQRKRSYEYRSPDSPLEGLLRCM